MLVKHTDSRVLPQSHWIRLSRARCLRVWSVTWVTQWFLWPDIFEKPWTGWAPSSLLFVQCFSFLAPLNHWGDLYKYYCLDPICRDWDMQLVILMCIQSWGPLFVAHHSRIQAHLGTVAPSEIKGSTSTPNYHQMLMLKGIGSVVVSKV